MGGRAPGDDMIRAVSLPVNHFHADQVRTAGLDQVQFIFLLPQQTMRNRRITERYARKTRDCLRSALPRTRKTRGRSCKIHGKSCVGIGVKRLLLLRISSAANKSPKTRETARWPLGQAAIVATPLG